MIRGTERFSLDPLDPRRRTGLILCGMGGPDGRDTIAPFLQNLFRDPAVVPLPAWAAGPLGWLIGRLRAPRIAARYALMNDDCRTPQLEWTWRQAGTLAGLLKQGGSDVVGAMAMRYWQPFPAQTVAELLNDGCEQFLVVPMYPQFSPSTSGSTLDFVGKSLRKSAPDAPVFTLADWHLLPGYLDALADPVSTQLVTWADAELDPVQTALVFVAHSLPQKFIDRGDPYLELTTATVSAVHRKMQTALIAAGHADWLNRTSGGPAPHLAFQSRIGPVKWLGPDVVTEVSRLAAAGCRRLLVQPVSFTCEHVETLVELDVELRHRAAAAGIDDFQRGPALNLNENWLASLADHLQTNAFPAEVA